MLWPARALQPIYAPFPQLRPYVMDNHRERSSLWEREALERFQAGIHRPLRGRGRTPLPHRGLRGLRNTGQKTPEGFYNLEKMLSAMLSKGVEIKVCGTCINARGIDIPELVEGVERGSMKALVGWIRDSDEVISF